MARNKITFKKEWEDNRWIYSFTGSQRQPTLNEIHEFIVDNRLQDEIDDAFMVCAIKGRVAEADDGFQFGEVEEDKTVDFWGYEGGGGTYDSSCPICGHERDMSGKECPVCMRPWEE